MIKYEKHLKYLSRELRSNTTEEEDILWAYLRKKQILNITFYRQKPLLGYIVDFYSKKINLVIELDGSQHFIANTITYDKLRTKCLESHGVVIKRYTNSQIRQELENVLNDIYMYARSYIDSGKP